MVISLINHKGGVGKTTSTASIGAGLARMGKRVLLIDIDPQANLTINFSLSPDEGKNIYESLLGKYPLPIVETKSGVDLVKSTLDLSAVELEIQAVIGRENILKDLIKPVKKKYEYILIDCPPSLGILTINALVASDRIILPIEPGRFAVTGMTRLQEIIKTVRQKMNRSLKEPRILITKFDNRKTVQKETVEIIKDHYGEFVFKTIIRMNVAVEESQMLGKDVFEHTPDAAASKDYENICKEIINE